MRHLLKYILTRLPNFFLIGPLFLMQGDQKPVDNLTVLDRLASTVVQAIIDQISPDSSTSFIIRSQNQQETRNWWLENWFVKDLNQRGISQIYIKQQATSNELIIEYQILSLGVQYFPTSESDLLQRKFLLNLTIRALEGSTGLVKLFDEFTEQYVDTVMVSHIKELEHKDFSFTQATIQEKRGFKRYIEPLIVMTTSAGVVYLFFRLRSK